MSIKKSLVLFAAGFFASSIAPVFAGGPDQAQAAPESLYTPAIYVDAQGGYSFYSWNPVINNNTGTIWYGTNNMTNNHGGGVGGVDVGFQIFKNIAFEVGGFYLPQVKGIVNTSNDVSIPACTVPAGGTSCSTGSQWNWLVFTGGRFETPVPYVQGLNLYAKVGAGWRGMSNSDQVVAGNGGGKSYWNVVFGAGMDYDIRQSGFRVGAEWLHIPGNSAGTNNGSAGEDGASNHSSLASTQPAQNLLTGSVGYKFAF